MSRESFEAAQLLIGAKVADVDGLHLLTFPKLPQLAILFGWIGSVSSAISEELGEHYHNWNLKGHCVQLDGLVIDGIAYKAGMLITLQHGFKESVREFIVHEAVHAAQGFFQRFPEHKNAETEAYLIQHIVKHISNTLLGE
jgi:hypothetical protein